MSKTISTSVQTEGFEAIPYPGNGRTDKVLIVVSGSDGGMALTKQESEFYHRNGDPRSGARFFQNRTDSKRAVPRTGGVCGAGGPLAERSRP